MLSLSRGTPIALALDKEGGVVHTLHITPDNGGLPDIEVDCPLELIDEIDIKAARRDMKLGTIDTRRITNAIQKKDGGSLPEGLKRAFDVLESKANKKLKKEILFKKTRKSGENDKSGKKDEPNIDCVIPLLGEQKFDRSILLVGPSGSGKSFLAKKMLLHDVRNRPVILFSKVRDDPSLKELKKMKSSDKEPKLVPIPIYSDDDLVSLPAENDMKGSICFFDDIDAFTGERAQYLRNYRDSLLEAGRHKDITVMSTSHILSNYNKTRTMLNEAEYVVLFPNSNRRSADMFLKDRMGMTKGDRDHLISRSGSSGRYMIIRMSCPNLMIHSKGILLL